MASLCGHLQEAHGFCDVCRLNHELPEDGQEVRLKHDGAIFNKSKHCATSWYWVLYM